ncbi:MAG: hypothetical protein MRJ65_07750 [Candidatus Brocadiaceae bacterium]|nr:hypothetical protein [Candidatus Brocadiaceae bacterium]
MRYLKLTPYRIVLIGFLFITVIGTVLLMRPFASADRHAQSFVDALFVAASALSTTGLSVVDVGQFYSFFGQIVILILFQIGGLGYMLLIAVVMQGLGIRLSLGGKLVLEESFSTHPYKESFGFSTFVCIIAFGFEFLGAVALSIYWYRDYPLGHAIYLGIFHSVSSFCTAGFSLFPDNLCSYRDSIFVNVTLSILSIAGCIGFPVLYDLLHTFFGKAPEETFRRKLTVHTKLALCVLPILFLVGWLFIVISEWHTPYISFTDWLLTTSFQTISTSTTTGFNTVDIGSLKMTGLMMMAVLMYIGAPAGGTGGGVKSTTIAVFLLSIFSTISKKNELVIFNRRISYKIKDQAFAICAIAMLFIIVDLLILTMTEKASFLEIVFETFSAFGTVGLSAGITSSLSVPGKVMICMSMLAGRIGPLVIGYSIRGKTQPVPIKYPEGVLLIG